MTHLSSADISSFYQNFATFVILRNADKDWILMHHLLESLKVALIKMVGVLMMPAKLAGNWLHWLIGKISLLATLASR